MATLQQLPVYRDTYTFVLEIYKQTNRFSKDYRYSLGQDMKHDSLALFEALCKAHIQPTQRAQHLILFLQILEVVEIQLRLCADLNLIPVRHLAQMCLMKNNIEKQIRCWKNKYIRQVA